MAADPRDYKLDLHSSNAPGAPLPETSRPSRPFISVKFACCGVYQRIYRDASAQAYQGRCPRCGKPVRFAIGPGGTSARSFTVW